MRLPGDALRVPDKCQLGVGSIPGSRSRCCVLTPPGGRANLAQGVSQYLDRAAVGPQVWLALAAPIRIVLLFHLSRDSKARPSLTSPSQITRKLHPHPGGYRRTLNRANSWAGDLRVEVNLNDQVSEDRALDRCFHDPDPMRPIRQLRPEFLAEYPR